MNNVTVAIADDHKYLRIHVAEILADFGYTVVIQAADGKDLIEGISRLKQIPDICIVDINMPVMDGFATTRELKKRWPTVKVLGYSINNERNIIAEMFHCGADRFLNKDADPNKLNETLLELINQNLKYSAINP